MISDDDVVGLRALAEKATPGPWTWWNLEQVDQGWTDNGPNLETVERGPRYPDGSQGAAEVVVSSWGHDANGINVSDADAEFIAAASPDVVLALLDEITTLRAEVADRDADDQRRSEEGRTDWDYEHKIARAEAALTARDRGMCKARFSDEDPVECWLLAGHDGDHIVDGGAYMWTDIETRLRQAEAALADRDVRIEAAKEWRGWYASGECPSPSEWKELDRRLSVPAVPVPQDNPEATREAMADAALNRWQLSNWTIRTDRGGWDWRSLAEQSADAILAAFDVRPKNGEKP